MIVTEENINSLMQLALEAKSVSEGTSLAIPSRAHLEALLALLGFWQTCAKDLQERLAQATAAYDLLSESVNEFADEAIGAVN